MFNYDTPDRSYIMILYRGILGGDQLERYMGNQVTRDNGNGIEGVANDGIALREHWRRGLGVFLYEFSYSSETRRKMHYM